MADSYQPISKISLAFVFSRIGLMLYILALIGKTPLVRINNITKQHKIKAQVYAKMESLNPGYSVKDRIGISMVDWAETWKPIV